MSAEREIWKPDLKTINLEKMKKFSIFSKKRQFFKQKMMGTIKNFGQDSDVG